MIKKIYGVVCDHCCWTINHYYNRCPPREVLKRDGCVIKNGKHYHLECAKELGIVD